MKILIQPDELFLKGNNKPYFYSKLISNLKTLIHPTKIERLEGSIIMEIKNSDKEKILDQLALIPGISTITPFLIARLNLTNIKKIVDQIIDKTVDIKKITKFRMTSNRVNKKFKYDSRELNVMIGDYVSKKYGLRVNLTDYQLNICLKVLNEQVLVFNTPISGIGGLPSGTSGKVLALLSGGIDSPVAAYQLMVRGCQVDLIHFHNNTHQSDEVANKISDICQQLSNYQPKIRLFMVDFGEIQKDIVMNVPADYRMIINRRIFLKKSQAFAQEKKYLAICTGDSLGQVASQTLENMKSAYDGINILKLMPLIGTNKKEIMNIARKIGTLAISELPYEDCCSMFVAKHPQTKSQLNNVLKVESKLDLSTIDKMSIKSYNFSMKNH